MHDPRTGGRDPGADAAVRGAHYAEEGACVPWATIAAIERATRDAADRLAAAAFGRQASAGSKWRGRLRTLRDRARAAIRGVVPGR